MGPSGSGKIKGIEKERRSGKLYREGSNRKGPWE